MQKILIAGGTGLIGQALERKLTHAGYEVKILSRTPSKDNQVFWDPKEKKIDLDNIKSTEVIINLCGAGVADERWTKKRKKELHDSRVIPADFLFSVIEQFPYLKQYISASGVNCYGYDSLEMLYGEEDAYGKDYLSQLVKEWEASADQFLPFVKVAKLRISMVLSENGGALDKLAKAVKWGVGSPIGSGKQWMTWVHMDDLVSAFEHTVANELEGAFNTLSNYTKNADFMKALARKFEKRIWLPNVPAFLMKLILGEMSEMLVNGVKVSNEKLLNTQFEFAYNDIDKAFEELDLK